MGRSKAARPPLPPPEKLRVEQRSHLRQRQRADGRPKGPAAPGKDGAGDSQRRARRRALALRRKLAAGLPRPLRCSVSTAGAGALDRASVRGLRAALSGAPLRGLAIAGVLGVAAEIVWVEWGRTTSWAFTLAILLILAAAIPVLQLLFHLWNSARAPVPAELSVLAEVVRIAWKDGPTLEVPIESIAGVEAPPGTPEDAALPGARSPATALLVREDGAEIHVQTTRARAHQLVAAVDVVRGALAGRRASQGKPRRERKERAGAEGARPLAASAPPLPSEAALAALDRGGRPLDAWKQALRAMFADTGYRRAPPLPPDDLLGVVTDPRISPERRIGAAIALSMRADEELVTRLRIASDALETEALRVAVERAAEGILEEDAIEEAVSRGGRKTAG